MSIDARYFDAIYAESDDPWCLRTRWYEERKRALTIAALPQPRYCNAFEPGCANGELTALLANRCDSVLATDCNDRVLDLARNRVGQLPRVRFERLVVPQEWPEEKFDLIIMSELGYYLDADALLFMIERAVASLMAGGTLLACHWRHRVDDYPQTGDAVHATFDRTLHMPRLLQHQEKDFLLDVWSSDQRSVAEREGFA